MSPLSSARIGATVALLGAGCAGSDRGADGTAGPTTTAPPLVADCSSAPSDFQGVRVSPTAVASVLSVSWSSTTPGRGALAVRVGDETAWLTPAGDAGLDHSVQVVGVPFDADLTLTPMVQGDDGTTCGDSLAARTGPLDPRFPALRLEATDGAALEGGYVLVPVLTTDNAWVAVLDDQGRPVWVWSERQQGHPQGGPIFKAMVAPDGSGVLFNTQGDAPDAHGAVTSVSWDGKDRAMRFVTGGHTDFALLPDGGFAMLGWTVREVEGGRLLLGDTVVVVNADGDEEIIWDAFDHIVPDLSRRYPTGFMPGRPDLEDWSHVNGISYDAERDHLLITIPLTDSVTRIDRQTGDEVWTLSGHGGTLDTQGQIELVHFPHSAHVVDGGLLIFNRHDWIHGEECSEAMWLDIDEQAGTAGRAASYLGGGCERVGFLGSAEPLPDGSALISWSVAAMLDVAQRDGQTAWRLRADLGAGFGFATWTDELQTPAAGW
jgi:hypothetical protein